MLKLNNNSKIKVIDAMMGSGKTTAIFEIMQELHNNKEYEQFVYISPNLSEVGGEDSNGNVHPGRIKEACKELNFKNPDIGRKTQHTRELLAQSENIAATHNLFSRMTYEDVRLIKENRNILIIDEALDVIEQYEIKPKTLDYLLLSESIVIDQETKKVSWNEEKYNTNRLDDFDYNDLARNCNLGNIYIHAGTVLIKQFSPEILKSFDEVIVLTYMFEHSTMRCWCDLHKLQYEYLNNDELHIDDTRAYENARKNIKLVPKLLCMGHSLSQHWFQTARRANLEQVKRKMERVVKNGFLIDTKRIRTNQIMFTCPKIAQVRLRGHRYNKAEWVASSIRATNDYGDKRGLMYILNKFYHPYILQFLISKNVTIDEDQWALSELLQWVYRGCIRNHEHMVLYIASRRMFDLFNDWINKD